MRKVILNVAVSLDGFIEGPNGEYDWCFTDQDYGMTELFGHVDAMFIGRKSWELIAGHEAEYFPAIQKIYLFSDTVGSVDCPAIEIVRSTEFDTKVEQILEEEGQDIWLFGGSGLTTTFVNKGLVSNLTLSVHPLILGGGKPLFNDIKDKVELLLTETQSYETGLVQLKYALKPQFDESKLDVLFTASGIDEI